MSWGSNEDFFKRPQKLWLLGLGTRNWVGRRRRAENRGRRCAADLKCAERLPEKVLIEKVTSVLGSEGVSQWSWGQERAFKPKVGNGRTGSRALWENLGPETPDRWALRCKTRQKDKEDISEGTYLFYGKDLELS